MKWASNMARMGENRIHQGFGKKPQREDNT